MYYSFSKAMIVGALLWGSCGTYSALAQTADKALIVAQQQLLRQEYAAASATYQQALKQQSGAAHDYYFAAQAAAKNHEAKAALELLGQAVSKGFFREQELQGTAAFASLTTQRDWTKILAAARQKQRKHEAGFNQPLVRLLEKMHYQDQHYRVVAEEADRQYGVNSRAAQEAMAQQGALDPLLIRQADSLLTRNGYPGKAQVGEYQKGVVFFIIQHTPDEKYLPLLTAAADRGDISWSALALLVDRLKTEKGEKQVYGSQSHFWPDGRKQLYPIEDEPNVNLRRAKVGMVPLELYLQQHGITYQVPTAAHNPNPPELYVSPQAREEYKSPVELIGSYEELCTRLTYPAQARKNKVTGDVVLQMVIDPQGVPQKVLVVKGLGSGCDEEAQRVMRTARFTNSSGEDHEIRMSLPFSYDKATAGSGK
ncbi:energy transducer TonB [Hymenobacter wooponensis]|uniref:Energy transducer TonB n=1 Tax=Hymenobacter wooponensis TaxID=1525360 RepID=A0A4Z0MU02_9BACT|nr:energy transducer TonB [Hymenobacter wooponensis]TGD82727.1 energy transducer TonB [Hymenobacter wooponensis]